MMLWCLASALAAPLAAGDRVELELDAVDGTTVSVPDPDGRTIVLELIRSPEW